MSCRTARHKEAAEMFINFMCETEVALANAEYICYSSPQTEVRGLLPPELAESELMYPSEEYLALCETMLVLPTDINDAMSKAWSDVRSYDSSGRDWVFPVMLAVMLALSAYGYWRKAMRKRRNQY